MRPLDLLLLGLNVVVAVLEPFDDIDELRLQAPVVLWLGGGAEPVDEAREDRPLIVQPGVAENAQLGVDLFEVDVEASHGSRAVRLSSRLTSRTWQTDSKERGVAERGARRGH